MSVAKAAAIAAILTCGSASVSAFSASNGLPSSSSSSSWSSSTCLSMSAALIVQNKGGGHGELGFQLAKTLSGHPKITSVTILQDDACDFTKEPFASYASDIGDVRIVKASLGDATLTAADVKALLPDSYDYVWDNASKSAEGAGKAVVDCAKDWNSKLLTYVSSAGVYSPGADCVFPMKEDSTPVKDTAGQVQYERYAVASGLPLVSFRPQYIYGEKSNKWDYIDWYLDRIARKEPLPIPGDGSQKVSLTNSADVAALLASVLDDEEAAVDQRYFNCGTDRLYSYDEVADLCAKAAGGEADIRHYDAALGKAKFPFRLTDFYVAPDMAKDKLGWEGARHGLEDDLAWYWESYKKRGGDTKEIDFDKDKQVLN